MKQSGINKKNMYLSNHLSAIASTRVKNIGCYFDPRKRHENLASGYLVAVTCDSYDIKFFLPVRRVFSKAEISKAER